MARMLALLTLLALIVSELQGHEHSLSGEVELLRASFLAGDEDALLLHIEHLDRLVAAHKGDHRADDQTSAGFKGETAAIRAASERVDDMEHQGEEVRQQVALLFDEIELEHRDAEQADTLPSLSHSTKASKKSRGKKSPGGGGSNSNSNHHADAFVRPKGWTDRKEVSRLRQVISQMKQHQAAEMDKLVAVKRGVEALVRSLNGTKTNLASAKHESTEMEAELQNLHKQARSTPTIHQFTRFAFSFHEICLTEH